MTDQDRDENFGDLFFKSESSDQYAAAILRGELARAPGDVDSLSFLQLCLEDPLDQQESVQVTLQASSTSTQGSQFDDIVKSLHKDLPFLQRTQSYSREDLNAYISRQMTLAFQPKSQPQLPTPATVPVQRQAPVQAINTNPRQITAPVAFQYNSNPQASVPAPKPRGSLQSLVGNRSSRNNPEYPVHVQRSRPEPSHEASTFHQRNPARKRVYEREVNVDEESEAEEAGSAFVSARSKLKKTQHKQPRFNRSNSCNSGDSDSYNNRQNHGGRGNRKRHRNRFKPPARLHEQSSTNQQQQSNRRRPANNSSKPGGYRVDHAINDALKRENGGGSDEAEEDVDPRLKGLDPELIARIESEVLQQGESVTFDDIAGLEFAKQNIEEIVVWPIKNPEYYTGLRQLPKGLLLFGPPGTGKTLIGKAIAHEVNATFFSISASSLTSKWIGEGEKTVRALFGVAALKQPSVVFIDEIDSLLCQRSSDENEASRRIKTEFLVQLDGAATKQSEMVLTIGATNRPQELDEAARRRFVKRLYIPLPDEVTRRALLAHLLKKNVNEITEEQLAKLCELSKGYSGADVTNLAREASMGPLRDKMRSKTKVQGDGLRPIKFEDFLAGLRSIRASVSEKDLEGYKSWNNEFGTQQYRSPES